MRLAGGWSVRGESGVLTPEPDRGRVLFEQAPDTPGGRTLIIIEGRIADRSDRAEEAGRTGAAGSSTEKVPPDATHLPLGLLPGSEPDLRVRAYTHPLVARRPVGGVCRGGPAERPGALAGLAVPVGGGRRKPGRPGSVGLG